MQQSGVATQILLDSNGKDLAIRHIQDCDAILDWNAESRRDTQDGDWGRHIARIPNLLYVKWLNEEAGRGNVTLRMFTPEFDAIVKKKLYDPEYAYLRCDKPALQVGWHL
jgi:hypothetical protein